MSGVYHLRACMLALVALLILFTAVPARALGHFVVATHRVEGDIRHRDTVLVGIEHDANDGNRAAINRRLAADLSPPRGGLLSGKAVFFTILLLVGVLSVCLALCSLARGRGGGTIGVLYAFGGVFIYLGLLGCSFFL